MTEKSRATVPSLESWPDTSAWTAGWLPFLTEANRLALDQWMKSSEALLQGALTISQEMAEFAQARLREDVEVCGKLAKCHDPNEAAECQREFVNKATAQYLEHANKLAALMTQLAGTGIASVQRAVTERSEAAPRRSR
jgi:hypothetical protein